MLVGSQSSSNYFLFCSTKKEFYRFRTALRVIILWQNFQFWMEYPFKLNFLMASFNGFPHTENERMRERSQYLFALIALLNQLTVHLICL